MGTTTTLILLLLAKKLGYDELQVMNFLGRIVMKLRPSQKHKKSRRVIKFLIQTIQEVKRLIRRYRKYRKTKKELTHQ